MATTWTPMTRFEPHEWLLANGEVVKEPPLEQTTTGLKVRVAGTKDSFYSKDLDDLLSKAAQTIAAEKGTTVFLPLMYAAAREAALVPTNQSTSLHLTAATHVTSTRCWWKFKHPSMPFTVTLTVDMDQARGSVANVLSTKVVCQRIDPQATEAHFYTYSSIDEYLAYQGLSSDDLYAVREFIRDNPLEWADGTLDYENKTLPVARMAAQDLLAIVRKLEALDEIEWPDLRNPKNPGHFTLELFDSSVNSQFVSELTDYLEGAPGAEKAAAIYEDLLEALRSIGIVLNKGSNDLLSALNTGTTFSAQVTNLAEEGFKIDHSHALTVNIPTGTFIVDCNNRNVNLNEVAEQWEEAKTLASLTGQEDELLAYAREYAKQHSAKRAKRILKERGA